MGDALITGTAMTAFGKFPDTTLKGLAGVAVSEALGDAELAPSDVETVFFANAAAGLVTGQEMVRGQVALRETGLAGLPVINVENACASGSTAFHLAHQAVASGHCEVALAVGAEKLVHPDKQRSFGALASAVDLDRRDDLEAWLYGDDPDGRGTGSVFMDIYARLARDYTARTGATPTDFARVAAKNHRHGALNPKAQYRDHVTIEQVLGSRCIADPLTLLMCSPIGDGAAAVVVCSPTRAHRAGVPGVRVRSTAVVSGCDGEGEVAVVRAAHLAYERAGLAPQDLDVVECHDAAAPAELQIYEELGLCGDAEGPRLLADGETELGGRVPVNPSGGLLSKGHPVGATGLAQLVELADQLRGRGGDRQVEGACVGLAENAGGFLGPDHAAAAVTIISA